MTRLGRLIGIAFLMMIVIGLLAPAALAQSLDCPTCAVDDVVGDTTGAVKDVVDDTTGDGGSGGGGVGGGGNQIDELDPTDDDFLGEDFLTDDVPDVVGQIVDPEKKKKPGKNKNKGKNERPVRQPTTGNPTFFPSDGKIGGLAQREAAAAVHFVARAQNKRQLNEVETAGAFNSGAPSLKELVEALGAAVQALTFPLGLALAVVAYLMVQGRIDAKDPKLALAAVDAEEEYLSFQ